MAEGGREQSNDPTQIDRASFVGVARVADLLVADSSAKNSRARDEKTACNNLCFWKWETCPHTTQKTHSTKHPKYTSGLCGDCFPCIGVAASSHLSGG